MGWITLPALKPRGVLNPNWLVPGTSVLLFLSSLPRSAKGPILTVTSAAMDAYYGMLVYEEYR